jgi:hypothetical protein
MTTMNEVVFSALLLVALALFFLGFVWWKSKARGLSAAQKQEIWNHWHRALAIEDLHRRVMEGDKVLDHAMQLSGFQGSMADKLRKAGPRFSNVQALWDAHKLRNSIAHEVSFPLSQKEASRAMTAFEKGLRDLC